MGDLRCLGGNQYNEFVQVSVGVLPDDTLFTVDIPEPKELWPTIPNRGAQSRILAQVDSTIEEIVITLTDAFAPIDSQEVKITADWVSGSGGRTSSWLTLNGRLSLARPVF